jgi:hypothetical protein
VIYDDEAWAAMAAELPPQHHAWARPKLEQIAIDHLTMEAARPRHLKICAELREVYNRNANPAKTVTLFGGILDVWREAGGQLGIARIPPSPTIRFLEAALRPVLGEETPKLERLIRVIQTEQFRLKVARARASGSALPPWPKWLRGQYRTQKS